MVVRVIIAVAKGFRVTVRTLENGTFEIIVEPIGFHPVIS
jgi:hypothetical protein